MHMYIQIHITTGQHVTLHWVHHITVTHDISAHWTHLSSVELSTLTTRYNPLNYSFGIIEQYRKQVAWAHCSRHSCPAVHFGAFHCRSLSDDL